MSTDISPSIRKFFHVARLTDPQPFEAFSYETMHVSPRMTEAEARFELADIAVRNWAPRLLTERGCDAEAATLSALAPITDQQSAAAALAGIKLVKSWTATDLLVHTRDAAFCAASDDPERGADVGMRAANVLIQLAECRTDAAGKRAIMREGADLLTKLRDGR